MAIAPPGIRFNPKRLQALLQDHRGIALTPSQFSRLLRKAGLRNARPQLVHNWLTGRSAPNGISSEAARRVLGDRWSQVWS